MGVQRINPSKLSYNPIYRPHKVVDWGYSNFLNNIGVYGQKVPIRVDKDLCVVDGNKRLQALIELNIQMVNIIIVEELNFTIDICDLKPSEKLILLDVFENKYNLTQYSSKNASLVAKSLRKLMFGGIGQLRKYYELKKLLIELRKLNSLLYHQILIQLDSNEITINEVICQIERVLNKNACFDFRLFSLSQADILCAA